MLNVINVSIGTGEQDESNLINCSGKRLIESHLMQWLVVLITREQGWGGEVQLNQWGAAEGGDRVGRRDGGVGEAAGETEGDKTEGRGGMVRGATGWGWWGEGSTGRGARGRNRGVWRGRGVVGGKEGARVERRGAEWTWSGGGGGLRGRHGNSALAIVIEQHNVRKGSSLEGTVGLHAWISTWETPFPVGEFHCRPIRTPGIRISRFTDL